jgi:hypothetical protein
MKNLSEDHKEIQSGKKLDDEGYMARLEMDKIEQSLARLKRVIKTSDQQLPAWVQSKITKAADYLDTAADYLHSDVEMEESKFFTIEPKSHNQAQKREQTTRKIEKKATNNPSPEEAQVAKQMLSKRGPQLPEEISLVDKILSEENCGKGMYWCNTDKKCKPLAGLEVPGQTIKPREAGEKVSECSHTKDGEYCPIHGEKKCPSSKNTDKIEEEKKYMTKEEDPCWKGYEMVGFKKKRGKKVPNCVPVNEATTRLPMQTGQLLRVLINWRGKHLSVQMFFPQLGTPKRDEITYAVNKVYPDARVISYVSSEMDSSTPIVQVREESKLLEFKKSDLKCNEPKSDPVGDSKTGKSHVVKACEKGKEKLIRFGQKGVKGSPKTEGESEEDEKRRSAFKARHEENIKKGKMSAAYWSNKEKW